MLSQHNLSLSFVSYTLSGIDAKDFLQGQLTCDVKRLTTDFTPTAICNLKGRVQFGLWLKKQADDFLIIVSADCAEDFAVHIKKYGAFAKISLSKPTTIYANIDNTTPNFTSNPCANTEQTLVNWLKLSISQGNSVITNATTGLFQPQELRLHQRGGVHYDKGCYLGQEIVARLYFKAAPKAWLHRVAGDASQMLVAGQPFADGITIVNYVITATKFEALVVASPQAIEASQLTVLPLPDALNVPVARQP